MLSSSIAKMQTTQKKGIGVCIKNLAILFSLFQKFFFIKNNQKKFGYFRIKAFFCEEIAFSYLFNITEKPY